MTKRFRERQISFPEATRVKAGQLDEDWRIDSACRQGHSPELWHPYNPTEASLGVTICQTCPVAQACLSYALAHDERYGTWGGLTEWQRNSNLRRARRKAAM
jgi:WhiB family redox-sensing transcriptional regulator